MARAPLGLAVISLILFLAIVAIRFGFVAAMFWERRK